MDEQILAWATYLSAPLKAFLVSPTEMGEREGTSIHLLELGGAPPPRSTRRPPLSLSLRYLITTWAADTAAAHRLLGELAFAAMEDQSFEAEPVPPPLALWQALGLAPRPALVLRVPFSRARPENRAPLVRARLSVQLTGLQPLVGRLLGPGGIAIAAATVALPSLQLTTLTDSQGHFRFASVPCDPAPAELRINARGRIVTMPVPSPLPAPLLIELNETQI